MATLVLGTIGRAVLGPVGGIIGTFVGGFADRAILGGGGAREGARLSNLAVQSSAYGEPLPRLYGRFRVAGNLIWTSGIAEHAATSGGGKRGGARTTSYSYSASVAVALSARAIVGVGRVWADGKLLRDAEGGWIAPATMRVHVGGEDQPPDPLIAAAENGAAPAYRGLAYAVFEDLALADFGNRIPNLSFEVIADAGGGFTATQVVADFAGNLASVGVLPPIVGYAAARGGSVRAQLGELAALFDIAVIDDGDTLTLAPAGGGAPVPVADTDLGSSADRDAAGPRRETRGAETAADDAVAILFYDPARDFQAGLQRASRRTPARRTAQIEAAVALDAASAKALGSRILARHAAARSGATLTLPPRAFGIRAGACVARPGDAVPWVVRRRTLAGFVAEFEIERRPAYAAAASLPADAGRRHDFGDAPAGPTTLAVFELPPLDGAALDAPRIFVAGAGASRGWRRAAVTWSGDGGDSYVAAGEIGAATSMGVLTQPLDAGPDERWDRRNVVEVELLADAMWLMSRTEPAVMAGANLSLIGDEVCQFAGVEALGGRRFRLSGLLRGRRGSTAGAHPAGTRFVLLDASRWLSIDPGREAVGRTLRLRAEGRGDTENNVVTIDVDGTGLRPLAPVFVRRVRDSGGSDQFTWVRRSRSGFAWSDAVDAPLGEAREAYAVEVRAGGTLRRSAVVDQPAWTYDSSARAADAVTAGTAIELHVAQLGDAGRARVAVAAFIL